MLVYPQAKTTSWLIMCKYTIMDTFYCCSFSFCVQEQADNPKYHSLFYSFLCTFYFHENPVATTYEHKSSIWFGRGYVFRYLHNAHKKHQTRHSTNIQNYQMLISQCVSSACAATDQNMTSYSVAFLSPEPVTMYLSSVEMSQHNTDEDSFD